MSKSSSFRQMMRAILLCTAAFYLWGLQRNLPYTPEIDEPIFVVRAIQMAVTNHWNPEWFGNPGSTILYPLAILYKIWFALFHGGELFGPEPLLQTYFETNFAVFYFIGRLLSTYYTILAIPLLYLLGKTAFDERTALLGAFFFIFSPVVPAHIQTVRTDGAGLFFCLLSLWLGILLQQNRRRRDYILCGLAIGCAIATRYFLIALLPFLLGCYLAAYRNDRTRPISHLTDSAIGLAAVVFAFVLTTPYFFLDFATAQQNLLMEARSTHLGQDGFTFWGNLRWYFTDALSADGKSIQTLFAFIGLVIALTRRNTKALTLLLFFSTFLVGIALSDLHWQRWVIQILPVWGLFAAVGMVGSVDFISTKRNLSIKQRQTLIGIAAIAIITWPAYQFALTNYRHSTPTTRILARHWVMENLPEGSQIVQDRFTVPFANTNYIVTEKGSIASSYTVTDYISEGQAYLIVKDRQYTAYFAEPEKYPNEVIFFETLFANYPLIYELKSSPLRGGPTIRIYQLR